ncbi:MAG: glucose 1-dehydrogenase [Chloroflexota bacterium]|nr:glucose 1-dehydrogenase [Chloroflexota bacterium]MDE2910387.1 glucose 1-dehydrogenase [Chloroflexota bacterium]
MGERLSGKSAFVTGAGGGIGRGIAEQLAANGASVTIAEINEKTGRSTADELRQAGYEAQFARVDIRSEDDIVAGIAAHVDRFGALDILVNNAGANQHYDASKMTVDEWERSMSLNLRGAWLCCKHALPIMAAGEGGVIVSIASVHATMTANNFFPYNVAKSGILGLTRSIALDWGPRKIRAVAVSPGWVRTQPAIDFLEAADDPAAEEQRVKDLHPVKRIGEPKDIGALVAFLASDEAGYITGSEIVIDGGISARYAG